MRYAHKIYVYSTITVVLYCIIAYLMFTYLYVERNLLSVGNG